jgi:hypothetical protein
MRETDSVWRMPLLCSMRGDGRLAGVVAAAGSLSIEEPGGGSKRTGR